MEPITKDETLSIWQDQVSKSATVTLESMQKAYTAALGSAPSPYIELVPHRLYQLIVEEFDGTNYAEARVKAHTRWVEERLKDALTGPVGNKEEL